MSPFRHATPLLLAALAACSAQSPAMDAANEAMGRTPPAAPTGLTAGIPTGTTVGLTWTAATDNIGVTGYDVLRDGVVVGSSTTTSFSDSGLTAETTYGYAVRAKDAAGNLSALSSAVSVTTPTPDTTPPSVPTGLAASGTTWTGTTPRSWTTAIRLP